MAQYEFVCERCGATCVRILKMADADSRQLCQNFPHKDAPDAELTGLARIVCSGLLRRIEIPSSQTITHDKRWSFGVRMSDGSVVKGREFGSESRKWKGFGP